LNIALWTAFFVNYAKPFKQTPSGRGVTHSIRVDPAGFVPDDAMEVHEHLIKVRDKMYAHSDYNSNRDEDGVEMIGVIASVNGRGELKFGFRSRTPPLESLEALLHLTATLRDRAEAEYVYRWEGWRSVYSEPMPSGCWDVNIAPSPDDVFVAVRSTTVEDGSATFPRPL
jgi:hypothetical protein